MAYPILHTNYPNSTTAQRSKIIAAEINVSLKFPVEVHAALYYFSYLYTKLELTTAQCHNTVFILSRKIINLVNFGTSLLIIQ